MKNRETTMQQTEKYSIKIIKYGKGVKGKKININSADTLKKTVAKLKAGKNTHLNSEHM